MKLLERDLDGERILSHPTRVRGLKQTRRVAPHAGAWIETFYSLLFYTRRNRSHPTRVRGLKLTPSAEQEMLVLVAPHAGAWIETLLAKQTAMLHLTSHPTRVRGLKQNVRQAKVLDAEGRTPRGCVD